MDEDGSIGIGAMIVFIALILVAAVASTIIIKTAEELQQNAENTSSDTRQQISGKISISDVFVDTVANPLAFDHTGAGGIGSVGWGVPCGQDDDAAGKDCPTDVATFAVIARVSSGSLNVQEGDVRWYITCKVTYVQIDGPGGGVYPTETLGKTFAVVDSQMADAKMLDGTDIEDGDELSAGTTFRFEIDLGPTNLDDEGGVNQDIEDADFETDATPGCDAEAGSGQELNLRIVVDGGGETLAYLKIDSIKPGTSVM
jgi:hypothetical protein